MADITFLAAGIGGGKSYLATTKICNEFARSDRHIVTDVPVYVTEEDFPRLKDGTVEEGKYMTLGEWCHEYVEQPVDVLNRIRILKSSEHKTFYRHFPGGYDMPLLGADDVGKPYLRTRTDPERVVVDEEIGYPNLQWRIDMIRAGELPFGCFFLLDEVHLKFGAREWQKIGKDVGHYMSHLRKFNDDIYLITQHAEKVDKNFRRDATQWIYIKNFSRKKIWGGVTLPGRFRYEIFDHQPQRGDEPDDKGWLQLQDKSYHKCYNTMSGTGISGLGQPESSMIKGLHWRVYIIWVVVLALLGCTVPRYMLKGTLGAVHGITAPVGHLADKPVVASGQPQVQSMGSRSADVRAVVAAAPVQSLHWQRDIIVDAVQVSAGVATVWLSNGDNYTLGDGHFTSWADRCAVIDNTVYRFLTREERLRWEKQQDFVRPQGGEVMPARRLLE